MAYFRVDMSVQVKHRRDTATNISINTPAQGEIWVDLTNAALVVGDGFTVGGWRTALESFTAVSDAPYTTVLTDRVIGYRTLTGSRTVLLPSAGSYPSGAQLIVVDLSGNASTSIFITVVAASGDQIKGASPIITSSYGSVSLIYDATSSTWVVLGSGVLAASWTPISSSQTISAPGRYKVISPGLTLTFPNGGVGGDVVIKDRSNSSSPSITLNGTFDGQSGFNISRPNAAVTLAWDASGSSYIVL